MYLFFSLLDVIAHVSQTIYEDNLTVTITTIHNYMYMYSNYLRLYLSLAYADTISHFSS